MARSRKQKATVEAALKAIAALVGDGESALDSDEVVQFCDAILDISHITDEQIRQGVDDQTKKLWLVTERLQSDLAMYYAPKLNEAFQGRRPQALIAALVNRARIASIGKLAAGLLRCRRKQTKENREIGDAIVRLHDTQGLKLSQISRESKTSFGIFLSPGAVRQRYWRAKKKRDICQM